MRILSGHTSPETAFIVNDYPYGFCLRCKIRYWLEYDPRRGFRMMYQTTNPKVSGEVWNKPKATTYALLGGALVQDESNGHVSLVELTEYSDYEKGQEFLENYGHTMPDKSRVYLERWVQGKKVFNRRIAEGASIREATITVLAEVETVLAPVNGRK